MPYNLRTCLFLCYFTILPCHSVVTRYLTYFLFVFHRTLIRFASWSDCLAWKSRNGCWIHSLQWKTTVQLLWITESATLPKCASSYLKAATFTVCTSTLWTERPPSRKFYRKLVCSPKRTNQIQACADFLGCRAPPMREDGAWSWFVRSFGHQGLAVIWSVPLTGTSFRMGDGEIPVKNLLESLRITIWFFWAHRRVKKTCWTCGEESSTALKTCLK